MSEDSITLDNRTPEAIEDFRRRTQDLIQMVSKLLEDPKQRMAFHKKLTAWYFHDPLLFAKFKQGTSRCAGDVRLTYWDSFVRLAQVGDSESIEFEAKMFELIEEEGIVAVAPYDVLIEGRDGVPRSSFLTVGVGEPTGVPLDQKLREYERERRIEETDANITAEKGLHYAWIADTARLCASRQLFFDARLPNGRPLFRRGTPSNRGPTSKGDWKYHFSQRNLDKWWGSPNAEVQHPGTLFSLLENESRVKEYRERFDAAVEPMFEEVARVIFRIPRFDRSRTNGAIFQGVNHHYDFEKREVTTLPFELANYLASVGYSMEYVVLDRDETVNGTKVYDKGERVPFNELLQLHFLREFANATEGELANGEKELVQSPQSLIQSQAANGAYCRIPTSICTIVNWMVPVMDVSALPEDLYSEAFSNIRKPEENLHNLRILWSNWAKYTVRLPLLYQGTRLEDPASETSKALGDLILELKDVFYRALADKHGIRDPEYE